MNISIKNTLKILLPITFILLIVGAFFTYAAYPRHIPIEDEIKTIEILNENQYLMSANIITDNPIVGDILSVSETLYINSRVTGDIAAFATSILIDAPITGDVRVIAGDVFIRDNVSGELVSASKNLFIADDVTIKKDVMSVADKARIEGTINGDLKLHSSQIEITGTVLGNVETTGKLHILKGAVVRGDVIHTGESEEYLFVDEEATIIGETKFIEADSDSGYYGLDIIEFIFLIILSSLIVYAFFRYGKNKINIKSYKSFLSSFALGLAFVIAIPIISIILTAITGWTITFFFFTLTLYLGIIIVGSTFTIALVAMIIHRIHKKEYKLETNSLLIATGIYILFAIFLIELLIVIDTILMLVILGMIARFALRYFSK